jgi:hypothetical protein
MMEAARIAFFCFLSLCALYSAFGAGQEFNLALPGHYHDSDPSVYRADGFLFAGLCPLFALGALYLLARIVGGARRLCVPMSGVAMIAALTASLLPYEGWIDATGFLDSVGYSINLLLIGLTVALAQMTVMSLKRQKVAALPRPSSPTRSLTPR